MSVQMILLPLFVEVLLTFVLWSLMAIFTALVISLPELRVRVAASA